MVGGAAAPLLTRPLRTGRSALRAALKAPSCAGFVSPGEPWAWTARSLPGWPGRPACPAPLASAPAARAWGCAARLRRAAPRFAGRKSAARRSALPPTSCRPDSPSARRASVGLMAALVFVLRGGRLRLPCSEFGPIFLLAASWRRLRLHHSRSQKNRRASPRKAGGRAPKFSTWDAAHRGKPPARDRAVGGPLGRDGRKRPAPSSRRLPPSLPFRPRGRSRSGAGGETARSAVRPSLRLGAGSPEPSPWPTLGTAGRSQATSRISGAAPRFVLSRWPRP